MSDATCYESSIRYPTGVKLLLEGIDQLHRHMCKICKYLRIRCPRNKYPEVKQAYLIHSKKRKRKASATRMLKRRLLELLEKLLDQIHQLIASHGSNFKPSGDFLRRLNIITRVLEQQKLIFQGHKVKDRIVSIDKHYIRPIVHGKEVKAVEFGAKVNTIQADGISFIQHINFDAFNEGTQLKNCVSLHHKLFKKRVRCLAADAIYATNANRKFCSSRSIMTSFVRKGRAAKDEPERKVLRAELSRQRATRLEGSYGTHKEHYGLRRVRTRSKLTEILWIFFGIHTANAVLIASRQPIMNKQENRQAG